MQTNFQAWVNSTNALLQGISNAKSDTERVTAAIALSNHVLSLITSEATGDPEDIIGENVLELPNAERFDAWFQAHPDFVGPKAVFNILDGSEPALQAKLYWLKKRSNALMAGAVHFTPNWEDAEWSRNSNYKVGIDFFLSPDAKSIHIVLSNFGKLRVLELGERLNNTDIEVLQKWHALDKAGDLGLLHNSLWESFKLQSVNAKFYNGVAEAFTELHNHLIKLGKPEEEAKMFSSRLLGRLIFIWFIRKMKLINETHSYFETDGKTEADYYQQSLERLFFRTLNLPAADRRPEADGSIDLDTPYLNGGLFTPRHDDWVGDGLTFPQSYFSRLFSHFGDFNFTTDESTTEYEQVAIDPEMLGRVFESLLASQTEETGEQARKAKGTFYTPREIVSFMCLETVREYLARKFHDESRIGKALEKLLDTTDQDWAQYTSNTLAEIPKDLRQSLIGALSEMKTLDPACGSGAFPLGMLQLLTKLHLRLDPRLDGYKLKLSILRENVFGSDIEPMAVEISRLRSWLSLIVEEKGKVTAEPLPNLEFNFVCANSLSKLVQADLFTDPKVQTELDALRKRYFGENVPAAKKQIQQAYLAKTKPDLIDARSNQLRTFNPFDEESIADFFDSEVMFGVTEGFDIVIGNPPYVDYRKISEDTKKSVDKYFVAKHSKMINLYLYFYELGFNALKVNGILAYISPQQYLIYENTKGLRNLIRQYSLISLSDFARVKVFDAATYTFVSILSKNSSEDPGIYREFDNLNNLSEPLRSRAITNPIPEPVDISEHSDLVEKISSGTSVSLGTIAEVFCASSSKETISTEEIGPKFLAASDIFEWKIREISKFVDEKKYSKKSSTKQHSRNHIVTSRMTNKIRASIVTPGVYLGGKINVVMPVSDADLLPIAAILNSLTINFWYRQKYSMQHMQGGALPINTTEIQNVPIRRNSEAWEQLTSLGSSALNASPGDLQLISTEIERVIFKLYGLDQNDWEIIVGSGTSEELDS